MISLASSWLKLNWNLLPPFIRLFFSNSWLCGEEGEKFGGIEKEEGGEKWGWKEEEEDGEEWCGLEEEACVMEDEDDGIEKGGEAGWRGISEKSKDGKLESGEVERGEDEEEMEEEWVEEGRVEGGDVDGRGGGSSESS